MIKDITEESFPNLPEAVNYFRSCLAHYRKGAWDKAIDASRRAVSLNPEDKLPRTYLERCEYLRERPQDNDWSGAWVMKTNISTRVK
jgi:adenylate cyclase